MPSPEMKEVIDSLWLRRAARASGPARSLAETRESYAPAGQLRPLPDDIATKQIDASGVPAYWLTAPEADPERVLLYLHGGGYQVGSLRSHGPLAAHLGRGIGRRVFFPEYRLAPEHPFPAAADDILTAWRWLVTAAGVDPAATVIAGDSAGGGLALTLLHTLRDAGEALPAGAVLISPFLDLTASAAALTERAGLDPVFTPHAIRSFATVYLNGADPRDPAASPLLGSQVGLPPLLIQAGGAEVLLSDSERLAKAAAAAGVSVTLQIADGLPHVYHGALDTPETAEATRRIAEFARALVPSRAEPFGRIPLEAYAAGASPVIATTAGGLAETVTEDSTGYTAPPADPRALAAAISRALAASPGQRNRLLAAGRQLTAARYDYQASIAAFLARLAPWATAAGQST